MANLIFSIFLFCLIIICSNVIQGITGFAGTLIAMPFLIMLIDLETAKQVLNVLGIFGSAFILIKDYKYIQWRRLGIILLWMTIGLIIGIQVYMIAPKKILLILFPLFVIAVGVRGFIMCKLPPNKTKASTTTIIDIVLLLSAGIIHGLFVAGGPLLVVYATEKLTEKRIFRATLSATWIFLNTIMLVQTMFTHTITASITRYMLLALIPMLIGILFGNYLLKKMSQTFFMKLAYTLLIISGISLLF